MIPDAWRRGEVAVVGLGRSGIAATRFLAGQGLRVYASDVADSPSLRAVVTGIGGPTVSVEIGRHDLERIGRSVLVIASPGVPPDAPPLRVARAADREILAELDLAALVLGDAPVIVVTGTNGKTTTTALIAHILVAAGIEAEAAGNIGRPLIEIAGEPDRPEWLVIEASSFQLHDAPHLRPAIGVLTNLSPDHLERYPTVEAYYADKRNLFRNASSGTCWVLNGDDPAVIGLAQGVPGTQRRWSLRQEADAWYDRGPAWLVMSGERLLERAQLPLLGDHNVSNALAAALAASAAWAEVGEAARGLESFRPLPHRLEPLREVAGVLWINDSKATNVSSTTVALAAMSRPFVLIAGGRPKGEAYAPLVPLLEGSCRAVVAYGEGREVIAGELGHVVSVHVAPGFGEAVESARRLAQEGEVVLLSPACASFDQFTDYEERGRTFRELVEAM